MTRYFIHLDHKYKTQYAACDIHSFNGFSADKYLDRDSDKEYLRTTYTYFCELIKKNNITYIDRFVDIVMKAEDQCLYSIYLGALNSKVNAYINSRRFREMDTYEKKVNRLLDENNAKNKLIDKYKDEISDLKKIISDLNGI